MREVKQNPLPLSDLLSSRLESLKKPANRGYPVQDAILELARLGGLHKGMVFKVWQKQGNDFIFTTLSQYKQGEIKNLKPFILMNLKKQ